jgi:hypothetical protein
MLLRSTQKAPAMDERSCPALKAYRDKRNFDITPEPADGGVANETERVFVIGTTVRGQPPTTAWWTRCPRA